MNIESEYNLKYGKKLKIDFPNLSESHNLIPYKVKIYKKVDGSYVPAKMINVSIMCDSTSLFTYSAPYFAVHNKITVSDYNQYIVTGCNFGIILENDEENKEHFNRYRVRLSYIKTSGAIIYQKTLDDPDSIFTELAANGYCTKLILSFSERINSLKLVSIFDLDRDKRKEDREGEDDDDEEESDWYDTLDLGDSETGGYMIDFVGPLKKYSRNLRYMKLVVERAPESKEEGDGTENERADLTLNVLAYGYKKL